MLSRYLEHEFLASYKHSHIVLLRPSMAMMLMQTPDPKTIKVYSSMNSERHCSTHSAHSQEALPDFAKTTHIFLPINDSTNPEIAEGGSHWSLLLISVVDGVAFHYDSLPPGNERDAQFAMRKMSTLLGKPLNFIQLDDSPLQENGSDCGVYVCLNMRHLLLKRLLMVRSDEKVSMSMGGRRVDAREGRKEINRIIESFRREGERRRS